MNAFDIKVPVEHMRTLMIISLALPTGALIFLILSVTVIKPPAAPLNFGLGTFELIFLAQAAVALPMAFFIPGMVFKNTAKKAFAGINLQAEIEKESNSEEPRPQMERFLAVYQTQMIIGLAILEGMALFGIVIYLMNQSMICWIVAGILILLMWTKFPTLSRVQNCMADFAREQEIEGDRKI